MDQSGRPQARRRRVRRGMAVPRAARPPQQRCASLVARGWASSEQLGGTCSAVCVNRGAARPSSACMNAADGAARSDASRSCSRRTAQVIPDVPIVGRPAGSHDHQRRSTAVGRRRKGVLWTVATGIEGGRYLVTDRVDGISFTVHPGCHGSRPIGIERLDPSRRRHAGGSRGPIGISSAQFTSKAHKMKRGHASSVVIAP